MNRTLTEWLVTYNSVRPHHSLGLRTPLVVAEQTGLLPRGSSARTAERLLATRVPRSIARRSHYLRVLPHELRRASDW